MGRAVGIFSGMTVDVLLISFAPTVEVVIEGFYLGSGSGLWGQH